MMGDEAPQFTLEDTRTLDEIVRDVCDSGFIPSFCTACYREGRTGDRFMQLAKTGRIGAICQPNALLTLQEYAEDYADSELKDLAKKVIQREIAEMSESALRERTKEMLLRIESGERDLRF
jgi:2-iminoacetate synthase